MSKMSSKPEDLYLYVFLNLAYDSMGRGRSCAQASHAANLFTDTYIIAPLLEGKTPDEEAMAWRNSAQGFGTQIVKAVPNVEQLRHVLAWASAAGAKTGLLVDPEYVIQDGIGSHVIHNLITGGYVFGDKTALSPILLRYPLLTNDPVDRKLQFTSES